MRGKYRLVVSISSQTLTLYSDSKLVADYPVSTSKYGIGSEPDSYKTPLGKHRICFKKGEGEELGTIFINGTPSGNLQDYDNTPQGEDWITSRILGLEGMEQGVNDNSQKRGILIHGTQDEESIGTPASHGCIRMKNADVIELYDRVPLDTIVLIQESDFRDQNLDVR